VVLDDQELLNTINNIVDAEQENYFKAVIGALLAATAFDAWASLLTGAINYALKEHSYEPTPIIAELIDLLEAAADEVEKAVRDYVLTAFFVCEWGAVRRQPPSNPRVV
jgi:hypothetical protein